MASVFLSTLGAGTVGLAAPASAAVTTVVGSAYGIYSSVGFTGATPTVVGPTPTVTLPAGGSATPLTATDTSEAVTVGPGQLFSSGPVTVTTVGTAALGSVTSGADVSGCATTDTTTGCVTGQITENPLTATHIADTCTANGSTPSGSTTITGGTLADESVSGGTPFNVAVPANPTPNQTFTGLNPSTNAPYKFVFNEQITNADGSLTVNAVHQTLNATLAGTQIVGQVNCGASAAAETAPAITSANTTTFTVGTAGSFTVTATGSPTPTLTESGALPGGVTFTGGVLSGTPAAGSAGSYPLTFTATNGVGSPATQSFTLTVAPAAAPTILVANGSGPTGSGAATVTGYPDPPAGCAGTPSICPAAPSVNISGSNTTIGSLVGIAQDPAHDTFVANSNASAIDEFAPGANANVAPIAILGGAATGLNSPQGIFIDPAGSHLFVANSSTVTEYSLPFTGCTGSAPATCNQAPIATLSGSATLLNSPFGVSVDASGNLWVAVLNSGTGAMLEFSMPFDPTTCTGTPSTCNTPPTLTLGGTGSGIVNPDYGLVHNNTLFVTNTGGPPATVTEYALPLSASTCTGTAPAVCNTPPSVTLSSVAQTSSDGSELDNPTGIAFDPSGNMFVTNQASPSPPSSVVEYSPAQYQVSGNPVPIATIAGSATDLYTPEFIVVQAPATATPLSVTTTSPLPAATQNAVYSDTLAATGGTSPYTWALASGSTLPAGLALSAAGVISGTPTVTGTFTFGVTATDSATPAGTATKALSLTVNPAVAAATVPTLVVGNSVQGASSLTEYPDGATGNVAPSNTITGANTQLGAVNGVAVDPAGDIFVASFKITGDTGVFEFAPGATANATPIAFLQGAATNLNGPQGIAIDASGAHLFVVNSNNAVTEYALPLTPGPTADNAAPIATISGAATGLNNPFGIGLDPAGDIFVANTASVTEYAPGANGNVAPIAVLAGANTGITSPDSVAVHAGVLLVSDASGKILEYPLPLPAGSTLTSPDNTAPVVTVAGPASGLSTPTGMVFDSSGNLFVANNGNSSVTGYAPSQYATTGDPTPYITIAGTNTGLAGVNFIALLNPTAPTPLTAINGPLPTATQGKPYSQQLPITGGTGPYTWSVTPGSTLPAGLTLSSAGVLSGTPTTQSTTSFSVTVTDSSTPAQSVTENVSLTVASANVSITTTSPLPAATEAASYTEALAANGGTPPYTWSLVPGSTLPAGLSLSADGTITGTPTAQGTSTFSVEVSDSASPPSTATKAFSLTVNPPPVTALSGVACTSATVCQAVGTTGHLGVVVPVINGVQGTAQTVPGTQSLHGVACPTANTCVAVGVDSSGTFGVVVPITDGVPGAVQPVTGAANLFGVACVAAGICNGVGPNSDFSAGVVVPITNGTPGAPVAVPGIQILYGVACSSASSCVAVGRGSSIPRVGMVVPITNGVPGAAEAVSGTAGLNGVACPAAGPCQAVGIDSSSNFGVVVPVTGGVPGAAEVVPGSGTFAGAACSSSVVCEAVGTDISFSFGAAAPIIGGAPGAAQVVPKTSDLIGIACPTTTLCVAVGRDLSGLGVVVDLPVSAPAAITSAAATTFTVGTPATFTVTATGRPAPTVTESGALPAGVTFTDGVLSGTPASGSAGTYPLVFTATNGVGAPATQDFTLTVAEAIPATGGYTLAASDGGVFNFGDAGFYGSMGDKHLNAPVVGMAATPDGGGYWLVASDGGIFTFGDAPFYGSMGDKHLNKPVVGMAATPDGGGYWLVASDGGIFTFGDAGFYGSMGDKHLNAPVVGMASTADGGGYWLVASDGGIFTFGDAPFYGSMGDKHLNSPVVGAASTADGGGYWLVASDGGIFTFGDAPFYGSMGDKHLNRPVVGMAATPDGGGYWLVASDGGIFTFGDAPFLGSMGDKHLNRPVVAMAASPF
ncbi:MAG TPA: putative Ig domain-containing protein [Acidimicrobiales bacterium]|nr:putative Ig domain-containing protein [Acidimicrobiales bacterium]